MSTVTQELERLSALHEKGALSDEEFAEAKQKALGAASASEKTDPVKPREAQVSAPGSAHPSSELKAVAAALLAAGGTHVASWFYFPSTLARQHEVLAVGGIIARLVVPLVVGAMLYRKLRGPPDERTADA